MKYKIRLDYLNIDLNEDEFKERVKKITFKFKELGQIEEYHNKTIAIITSTEFSSQVFSWINNSENYIESNFIINLIFF
jgi:hypothetical protein